MSDRLGPRRLAVPVAATVLAAGTASAPARSAEAASHNPSEALQKSLYFYDAERSGPSWWDPANDWSHQGLTGQSALSQDIPVYLGGKLAFGQEPLNPPQP